MVHPQIQKWRFFWRCKCRDQILKTLKLIRLRFQSFAASRDRLENRTAPPLRGGGRGLSPTEYHPSRRKIHDGTRFFFEVDLPRGETSFSCCQPEKVMGGGVAFGRGENYSSANGIHVANMRKLLKCFSHLRCVPLISLWLFLSYSLSGRTEDFDERH